MRTKEFTLLNELKSWGCPLTAAKVLKIGMMRTLFLEIWTKEV